MGGEVFLRLLDRRGGLLKRLYIAWLFKTPPWRLPPQADLIGLARPPEPIFRLFRRLHKLEEKEED